MIKQIVKLTSDTGYIPVMYAVISATVASTLATSYAWLEVIGYGIDLESEFNTLVATKEAGTKPDFSVLNGVKGAYSTVALSAISEYTAPAQLIYGDKNLGVLLN